MRIVEFLIVQVSDFLTYSVLCTLQYTSNGSSQTRDLFGQGIWQLGCAEVSSEKDWESVTHPFTSLGA